MRNSELYTRPVYKLPMSQRCGFLVRRTPNSMNSMPLRSSTLVTRSMVLALPGAVSQPAPLARRGVKRDWPNTGKLAFGWKGGRRLMAEVSESDLLKPGHHFGTGPYLLDLYRLLCMVLADRPLAEMEEHAVTIHRLRGEFVYPELIRILTSTATVLRILFDHYDREFVEVRIKPCGELFSDWPKKLSNPNTSRFEKPATRSFMLRRSTMTRLIQIRATTPIK
jgi:hypothetical protein